MQTVRQRAKEFCDGAFGPFGVDTAPYTIVVAELIQGAVNAERERCAQMADNAGYGQFAHYLRNKS